MALCQTHTFNSLTQIHNSITITSQSHNYSPTPIELIPAPSKLQSHNHHHRSHLQSPPLIKSWQQPANQIQTCPAMESLAAKQSSRHHQFTTAHTCKFSFKSPWQIPTAPLRFQFTAATPIHHCPISILQLLCNHFLTIYVFFLQVWKLIAANPIPDSINLEPMLFVHPSP